MHFDKEQCTIRDVTQNLRASHIHGRSPKSNGHESIDDNFTDRAHIAMTTLIRQIDTDSYDIHIEGQELLNILYEHHLEDESVRSV